MTEYCIQGRFVKRTFCRNLRKGLGMSKASERAYRTIREGILRGRFAPGDRLVEEELAEYCGVSRTPIRDAIRRLDGDMLVRWEPNRGAVVASLSDEDVGDLFEIRALIEGHAARRAAERADPATLDRLDAEVAAVFEALDSGSPYYTETFLEANARFHDAIYDMAGSERLREIRQRLVDQSVVLRTVRQFALEDLRRSNMHHADLIAALRAGDGQWAQSVMVAHILAAHRRLAGAE
ncbi:hypothetical protein CCR85_12885 [Rhodothalassium salexigens]|nr:hypothetical protein [Rhodothalassium salexigens]MBK5920199.1 hypothetical protein [Rhodothalassium salexigens]